MAMKKVLLITASFMMLASIAGCPKKGEKKEPVEPKTPPPVEPVEPAEPAEPAEPEEPPLPDVQAFEDTREATWGGTLGTMDQIKWIIVTQKETVAAASGPGVERTWILILKPAEGAAQWIRTSSDGEYTAGENGLIVTEMTLKDKGDAEHTMSTVPKQNFVEYQPVPEAALAAVKKAVEKTPVPKKASAEGAEGLDIEVSTEKAHVKAVMAGSIIVDPLKPNPALPAKGGKASKDLGKMATALGDLYSASQAPAPSGEGEEEE
jgi:predicted small lipoprotein YifL